MADYTILLCIRPVCKLFVAVGVPTIVIQDLKLILTDYLDIQPCLYSIIIILILHATDRLNAR